MTNTFEGHNEDCKFMVDYFGCKTRDSGLIFTDLEQWDSSLSMTSVETWLKYVMNVWEDFLRHTSP